MCHSSRKKNECGQAPATLLDVGMPRVMDHPLTLWAVESTVAIQTYCCFYPSKKDVDAPMLERCTSYCTGTHGVV